MTNERRLLRAALAPALLALIAGCGPSTSDRKGPPASQSGPSPATVLACTPSTNPADKNEICYVEVTPTPSGDVCGNDQVTVNPDQLTVTDSGGSRKRLRIRFQFNDESTGYRFCPVLGDGVFLKHADKVKHKQFKHLYATNGDGDGNNPPASEKEQDGCYKRFRVEFVNKVSGDAPANSQYDYVLNFRQVDAADNTVVACRKDPWIKNGQ